MRLPALLSILFLSNAAFAGSRIEAERPVRADRAAMNVGRNPPALDVLDADLRLDFSIEPALETESLLALPQDAGSGSPPAAGGGGGGDAPPPGGGDDSKKKPADPVRLIDEAQRAEIVVGYFRQWKSAFAGALEDLEQRLPAEQVMPAYAKAVSGVTKSMLANIEAAEASGSGEGEIFSSGKRSIAMLGKMEVAAASASSSPTEFRERVSGSRAAVRALMLRPQSLERLEQGIAALRDRIVPGKGPVNRPDENRPADVALVEREVHHWLELLTVNFMSDPGEAKSATQEEARHELEETVRFVTEERTEQLDATEPSSPEHAEALGSASWALEQLADLHIAGIRAFPTLGEFFKALKDPLDRIQHDLRTGKTIEDIEGGIAGVCGMFVHLWEEKADRAYDAAPPKAAVSRAAPAHEAEPETGDEPHPLEQVGGAIDYWRTTRDAIMESKTEPFSHDLEPGMQLHMLAPDVRISFILQSLNYADAAREAYKNFLEESEDVAASDPDAFEASKAVLSELLRLHAAAPDKWSMVLAEDGIDEAMKDAADLEDLKARVRSQVDRTLKRWTN